MMEPESPRREVELRAKLQRFQVSICWNRGISTNWKWKGLNRFNESNRLNLRYPPSGEFTLSDKDSIFPTQEILTSATAWSGIKMHQVNAEGQDLETSLKPRHHRPGRLQAYLPMFCSCISKGKTCDVVDIAMPSLTCLISFLLEKSPHHLPFRRHGWKEIMPLWRAKIGYFCLCLTGTMRSGGLEFPPSQPELFMVKSFKMVTFHTHFILTFADSVSSRSWNLH